ncbi:MAG: DUF3500 domain-containing protein [Sediminibacterium sp.]|nr:DUF3500 domain-containing protein [Sediminibacterium sp.]MBX9781466.1 DUF3500 domain-containing protein [Chitinophagaceae bacterium]
MNKKRSLAFLVFLALLLAGCSKNNSTNSTSTPTTNPTPSTGGAVGTTGVCSVSISSPSACTSSTGLSKIICLCDQFKTSLSSSQVATLQLPYTFANVKTWSNLPAALSPRLGLRLGDLTSAQVGLAKAIIKEITGSSLNSGYDEVQQLWLADDYLNGNGGGATYGSGNYYIAIFGTPATTGQFEILFTGHHKTVANTYKDGVLIGATPRFIAIEPLSFTNASINYTPVNQEKTAFVNLLSALNPSQLSTAKSSLTFSDLLLTPGKDWQFPTTFTGLQCNSLTSAQKALVLAAIQTYTNDVTDTDGSAILAKYNSDIDNTYITYSGTGTFNTQNDYIRIDGPNVWIEFSVQRAIVLTGVHYHSVWRDRNTDYGTTKP